MTVPTQEDVELAFVGTVTSVLTKNEQLRVLLRNIVANIGGGGPTQEEILDILANLDEDAIFGAGIQVSGFVDATQGIKSGDVLESHSHLTNNWLNFYANEAEDEYAAVESHALTHTFFAGLAGDKQALLLDEDGNAVFLQQANAYILTAGNYAQDSQHLSLNNSLLESYTDASLETYGPLGFGGATIEFNVIAGLAAKINEDFSVDFTGVVDAVGGFSVNGTPGVSGTFDATDLATKTVTVVSGIITDIS